MVLGGLKDKMNEAKDKVSAAAGNVSGDKMKEMAANTLEELNSLRPLLNQSGFIIGDVMLTASIPPSFGIMVEQEKAGVNN